MLDLSPLLMHHSEVRLLFPDHHQHGCMELKPVAEALSQRTVALCFLLLSLLIVSGCRSIEPPDKVVVVPPRPEIQVPVQPPVPVVKQAAVPAATAPALTPGIPLPETTNLVTRKPKPQQTVTPKPVVAKPLPIAPDYRWRQVTTEGPYIALTFDDGPNPKNTPALLDVLKQRGIPATFFVLGQNAAVFPGILQRMVSEGHEIGSHGWDHKPLIGLAPEDRLEQVRKTNEAIERAVGKSPGLIRPPYGATTPGLNRWLTDELKMTVVLWSVDSRDWENRDQAGIRREILAASKPGSIVLAHDIHRTTVSAMPATLDALIEKGYKFVTVSELLTMSLPSRN